MKSVSIHNFPRVIVLAILWFSCACESSTEPNRQQESDHFEIVTYGEMPSVYLSIATLFNFIKLQDVDQQRLQ